MSDLPAWWHEPHPCDGQVDVMFAPGARKDGTMAAKAICRTCPHIEPCRAHAHAVAEPYGVWGGEGPRTRFATLRNTVRGDVVAPPRRAVAVCGTTGGWSAHKKRGERPCRACLDAWNAYERRLRAERRAARAQGAA